MIATGAGIPSGTGSSRLPSYITPEGMSRLVEEYDFLLKQERPRVTAEVAWAASLGDRSENAEYHYGKKRLREIDRRLRAIRKRLQVLEVVDPSEFTGPVVRFGARVRLVEEDGTERELQVVGEDEIDPDRGRVSYRSPVGRALIGREEGDEVLISSPGGDRTVELAQVRYPG